MTLFLDVYTWFAIAINVCSIVTCRPIGSGASIIYCIYVISVAIAYVTLIKNYLLTYLLTYSPDPERVQCYIRSNNILCHWNKM